MARRGRATRASCGRSAGTGSPAASRPVARPRSCAGAAGRSRSAGYRTVRDVGDVPVISRVVNSLSGQELGNDYGDYYLATGARATYRHDLGARVEWGTSVGHEAIDSLPVTAAPASGTLRPNRALGSGSVDFVAVTLRRRSQGLAVPRDLSFQFGLEGGRLDGGATYARTAVAGHVLFPMGATRGLVRVQGGVASADLPAHRAFVLGGRGTLLGEDFRVFGGRRMALAHASGASPCRSRRSRWARSLARQAR